MHLQGLEEVGRIALSSSDRFGLWAGVVKSFGCRHVCEVGVYRGGFASAILSGADCIERYFMVDPWRPLEAWNKPLNTGVAEFEDAYMEALKATEAYADKTTVLRDVSKRALKRIEDGSLDFAYIDGDHTLRGITVDLVNLLPKMREGGLIGGDDFVKNIWHHGSGYSPTEVHPFAMYFAEANDLPFATLPHNQFCMVNDPSEGYRLLDLGGYSSLDPIDVYTVPGENRSEGRKSFFSGWRLGPGRHGRR